MYYFVLFKASWCGHCQNFQSLELPEIKKYIDNHNDFVKLIIYDADKNENIIKNENIEGFPTIRLYKGDNHKQLQKKIIEFQNRNAEHIKRVLKGFQTKITGGYNEHFKQSDKPKTMSYSSYYQNINGNVKGEEMVCKDGVCKRKTYDNKNNYLVNSNGYIQKSNDYLPYNEYTSNQSFYDVALQLRNKF